MTIKVRSRVHADEVRVCAGLWGALDKAHPRLPIDEALATELGEFQGSLLAEDHMLGFYGTWLGVFDGVRWGDDAKANGPRAGKELLKFVGYLGDVVRYDEVPVVPRLAAIRVMHGICGPWDEWLTYRQRAGQWQLVTTAAGAAALGGPACFPIEGEPVTCDFPWEHFDALLKPWVPQF